MNCIDKLIIILFTIILMGLSSISTYFHMKRKHEDMEIEHEDEILSIKSKSIDNLISSLNIKDGYKLILNAEIIDSSGNTIVQNNNSSLNHKLATINVPFSIVKNLSSLLPLSEHITVTRGDYKTKLCIDSLNKKAVIIDEYEGRYNIKYDDNYYTMDSMFTKSIEGEEFRRMKSGTVTLDPKYVNNSDKTFKVISKNLAYEKESSIYIKDVKDKLIEDKKDKKSKITDEAVEHNFKDKKETKKDKEDNVV